MIFWRKIVIFHTYTEHQREAKLSNLSEVKKDISYVSDHSDVELTQIPTLITNRPPKTLNTRTIEYQNFVRIPKATKRNKHLNVDVQCMENNCFVLNLLEYE
jgi:hypothetical protein